MRTRGKKYGAARKQVPERPHTLEEAVPLLQKVKFTKFDETVEMAIRLGVDPAEARGQSGQGIGRAEQEQSRHGHGEAGRGDCEDEAPRSEHGDARVGRQERARNRALDGYRRHRIAQ